MRVRISDDFPEDQRQMMIAGIQAELDEMWTPKASRSKEKLEEYAKSKRTLEMFLPKEKVECPMCWKEGNVEDIKEFWSCRMCPNNP